MSDSADRGLSRREIIVAASAGLALPGSLVAGPSAPPVPVMRYGRTAPEPKLTQLSAGDLTMEFDPELAFLRHIRVGNIEVLRGIYAAVRDRVWGTVTPRVSQIRVDQKPRHFQLSFVVECVEGGIDFVWNGTIRGEDNGTVRFSMDGLARSTFQRNRIGFCVLHPLRECAGKPCTVSRPDRADEEGRFPSLISPNQPFKGMKGISHDVIPGLKAEVTFEGDLFEMEDHRNWTDGNFKTYCTPLDLPFPVEVAKGTKITQSVTLKLTGNVIPPRVAVPSDRRVLLEVTSEASKLPEIGFGTDPAQPALTQVEKQRLNLLRPAHLRVDLRLRQPSWKSNLIRASSDAQSLNAKLECALFLSDDAESELKRVNDEVTERRIGVARWMVFHEKERSTSRKWIELARAQLKAAPEAKLTSGTNQYFAEFNRERPPAEILDGVCYSINPQVHAFDNASVMENLVSQADTVRSARSFTGERWLAVTPVTLKPRFNPQAQSEPPDVPGQMPPRIDPRQMALFGAAWTLGSIKYLAQAGADSVTYYQTVGWAGLMERESGSPAKAQFPSLPGQAFPLYHVFADVAEFAGGKVLKVMSSDPLRVEALMLEGRRRRLMVANLTGQEQTVAVPASLGSGTARSLDERSWMAAVTRPAEWRAQRMSRSGALWRLLPYALLTVDFT